MENVENVDLESDVSLSSTASALSPSRTSSMSFIEDVMRDECSRENEDPAEPALTKSLGRCRPPLLRTNSVHTIPSYPMCNIPKGVALIINIEEYENDGQQRRIGSHHDVVKLTELFEWLHFTVVVKNNLTSRAFRNEVLSFASLEAHSEANMMILVVLSHGGHGHIYTSDNMQVDTEWIYERFNNYHCPPLVGKPKFFIIQACRGQEVDQGQVVVDGTGVARPGSVDAVPMSSPFSDVNRARPTWEDMVISYSSIPGYASMRDHETGTWFIQSLVKVFKEHARSIALIDLLMMTSKELSDITNDEGKKQTCNIEMRGIYKRIYFYPNHNESNEDKQLQPHGDNRFA